MSAGTGIEDHIREASDGVKVAGTVCKRIAEMNGGPGKPVGVDVHIHAIVPRAGCVVSDHDVAARHRNRKAGRSKIEAGEGRRYMPDRAGIERTAALDIRDGLGIGIHPESSCNIYAASLDVNAAAGRNKERIIGQDTDIVLSCRNPEKPRDRGCTILTGYDIVGIIQPETGARGYYVTRRARKGPVHARESSRDLKNPCIQDKVSRCRSIK